MADHSVHENKGTLKRKGAGLFIIGVALFTIGLSIHNMASLDYGPGSRSICFSRYP